MLFPDRLIDDIADEYPPYRGLSKSNQFRIASMLPFSASKLWSKVRAGSFPRPVKLGPAITAWRVSEVASWLAEQSEGKAK